MSRRAFVALTLTILLRFNTFLDNETKSKRKTFQVIEKLQKTVDLWSSEDKESSKITDDLLKLILK